MIKKPIILKKPPVFTEEVFKAATKFTENEDDFNAIWETYCSNARIGEIVGAKGDGKSFGWALQTIYRFVNEPIFCSCWARNQYSHIVNTLKPTFQKALDFLASEYGLDYRPYLSIYNNGIYWDYDDGGKGRAIFFQNFESIQSFQGFTLQSFKFRFGELVIDEPLEDVEKSGKTPRELQELYALQEEKIPYLLAATIYRDDAPEGFKLKFMNLFNMFDLDHFLISNYLNKVIEIKTHEGKINQNNLNRLIKQTYLFKEDKDFEGGLGITCAVLSKFYIPSHKITQAQREFYQVLKKSNYRNWMITVCGFGFIKDTQSTNYYLTPYIFDEEGNLSKNIKIISQAKFNNMFKAGEIEMIADGFDPGKYDKASWVRHALTKKGEIVFLDGIEDIKIFLQRKRIKVTNSKIRTLTNQILLEIIKRKNVEVEKILRKNYINIDFFRELTSILLLDNDIVVEMLNNELENSQIRTSVYPAIRRDTKRERFGVISRQEFWKLLFIKQKIIFVNGTEKFLKQIVKQYIATGEDKRDESFNHEIYDFVNACEHAFSAFYKYVLASLEGN